MPRTTTIVFDTSGGSPVFHVTFPISTLPALAGMSGNETEDVKLVFHNRGGRPIFHIGGAEIGVTPADAWDSATEANAAMHGRGGSAEEGGVDGTPPVRVSVEEDTPRIPANQKGKGKEVQEDMARESSNWSSNVQKEISSFPSRDASPTAQLLVPQQYSYEEQEALIRGFLTLDCFEDVYQQGREEFAFALDPSQPIARPLLAEEEAEWGLL
ncbi:hypothetical protein K438DRAFT_1971893 [Mycena galopus ATCC 62051]|nr:hypothetical protein K438DRAFT_1971893 [Mycena galopus ATCC 62051]